VQAGELLAAARAAAGKPLTPAEIDATLWNRGRAARYKAVPRLRSRNLLLRRAKRGGYRAAPTRATNSTSSRSTVSGASA